MPSWSSVLNLDSIPESGSRFVLGECIETGIHANVYIATDSEMADKKIAIKIQRFLAENVPFLQQEYKVLKEYSNHPNLPDFFGAFKSVNNEGGTDIWFAMEYCEGGSVMDLIRKLYNKNRRMAEEHIAYILKETVKALIHLHKHHIIHRDICGNNILLTKNGEIKLVDFGLSRDLSGVLGKRHTCIGSACWMAPEVMTSAENTPGNEGYGSRADVWALGITAIELGDSVPPYQSMHPTRVMFQIVRNPPPGLKRPGGWSEQYNDFISECLEKNQNYRPFMEELLEHPFLTAIPDNFYYLTQELKKISEDLQGEEKQLSLPEPLVKSNLLKISQDSKPEKMYLEDLAAMENITEEALIDELKERFGLGQFHTFVGDVLLILNPNETRNIYDNNHHLKYICKSRSDNPPHIFSIADRAYQDALHHETPQYIILSGESGSGKTTTFKHLVDHLLFIGKSQASVGDSVEHAVAILQAFTNASTPTNWNSTRCVMKTQITFGATGKISGAMFGVQLLEKWRVSSIDVFQANFHILYYFYDAIHSTGQLNIYLLDPNRIYRYLRNNSDSTKSNETRNNPKENVKSFISIIDYLKTFEISNQQLETMCKTLSAILNLGEIRFKENEECLAEIENPECCDNVAKLLEIDEKKFIWALSNYCLVEQGTAVRRRNTCDQARDTRDILANTLYLRLVDWIVEIINSSMNHTRAIYGDNYSVNILDYFGFECFKRNNLEQLLVNGFNEQMQCLYTQRVFAWESLELQEENVTTASLNYYNNKTAVNYLLGKPGGVFSLLDEASKTGHSFQHVLDEIKRNNTAPIMGVKNDKEFYFSHFTGKINYDMREMTQENRDFLAPEMIDTLRLSTNTAIKEFFTNKLSKTGNLICKNLQPRVNDNKWSTALMAEHDKAKKLAPEFQYSQIKHMRTAIGIYRSVSLEILRELSVGSGSGGTHFIRCIQTDLKATPKSFQQELVKQQIRALSVLDTALARQQGYPHRISFPEFLRRYKFLAFDFNENVEVDKENCRLLLVRLKMEGWLIGRSKVFLKYYNEEYLSRLYESQVKKIVKIQAMMRAFLSRRNVTAKLRNLTKKGKLERQTTADLSAEAAAALLIQKAYRGYNIRKKVGPLIKESGQLDKETADFIKPFAKKWKNKSMFQVLLQYRSAKFQDLINLSQQIHIFNQNIVHELQKVNDEIDLENVDPHAKVDSWLGDKKPSVWKLPFHFDEIPYYDTEYLCDSSAAPNEEEEAWDSPLIWRQSIIKEMKIKDYTAPTPTPLKADKIDQNLISLPYTRDPSCPVADISHLEQEKPTQISPAVSDKVKQLSKAPPVIESPKHKVIGKIQTPITPIIISPKRIPSSSSNTDTNFKGANQDFEFIRSPNLKELKRRTINPIAELESIGQKCTDKHGEDEPPFNFQGILRKTNFRRGSLNKIIENDKDEELPYSKVLKNRVNKERVNFDNLNNKKVIVNTEIAPGIILEGIETLL